MPLPIAPTRIVLPSHPGWQGGKAGSKITQVIKYQNTSVSPDELAFEIMRHVRKYGGLELVEQLSLRVGIGLFNLSEAFMASGEVRDEKANEVGTLTDLMSRCGEL